MRDRIIGHRSWSAAAHAKVPAGHKGGMTDHHLKRKLRIVTAACEGIERFYSGDPAVASARLAMNSVPGMMGRHACSRRQAAVVDQRFRLDESHT